MENEDSHEDHMARERVNRLPAIRDDLIRMFNLLPAEERVPALDAVLKLLSAAEAEQLVDVVQLDDAVHARKRATKIRESFLASVRANVNLLASMTAEERIGTLLFPAPADAPAEQVRVINGKHLLQEKADAYARRTARALMVETWGQEAVDAALGGGEGK